MLYGRNTYDFKSLSIDALRAEIAELKKHVIPLEGTKYMTFDDGTPEGLERHNRNYYLTQELRKREAAERKSTDNPDNVAFNAEATAAGYAVGQRVQRIALSMLGPIGGGIAFAGTIVMRAGIMTVKCDIPVPASCNGKITMRKYMPLTTAWRIIA